MAIFMTECLEKDTAYETAQACSPQQCPKAHINKLGTFWQNDLWLDETGGICGKFEEKDLIPVEVLCCSWNRENSTH